MAGLRLGDELDINALKQDKAIETMLCVAAATCISLAIYSDTDLPEGTDMLDHLQSLSVDKLNQQYNHLLYLKNVAGELPDPLASLYENHMETLTEAIEHSEEAHISRANKEQLQFMPPKI